MRESGKRERKTETLRETKQKMRYKETEAQKERDRKGEGKVTYLRYWWRGKSDLSRVFMEGEKWLISGIYWGGKVTYPKYLWRGKSDLFWVFMERKVTYSGYLWREKWLITGIYGGGKVTYPGYLWSGEVTYLRYLSRGETDLSRVFQVSLITLPPSPQKVSK